jgi:hypothetical protein
MNLFKGLLFLHGYVTPTQFADFTDPPQARREYGAHTVADDLAAPLGNAVASQRWFGTPSPVVPAAQAGCLAGGCG